MQRELSARECMLLDAQDYYLLTEIPGAGHNPQILKFFREIGHTWVQTDETAWCSAFINYLAHINGIQSSGELNARSWQNIGRPIQNPLPGDIVIFWRESIGSWKGHVGLYQGHEDDRIHCLGGNQSNQVNISPYPLTRLLQFRRLDFIQT